MHINKKMKKFLPLLILVPLALAGCGTGNSSATNSKTNANANTAASSTPAARNGNFQRNFENNFNKVGIADVKTGDAVLVTGTTNSDGSVTADQIIVGATSTDLTMFFHGPGEASSTAPNPQRFANRNNAGANTGNGSFPNRNFAANGGPQGNFRGGAGSGGFFRSDRTGSNTSGRSNTQRSGGNFGQMSRLEGTVLSLDSTGSSLVVKLSDGSTKIVFYSNTTFIGTPKPHAGQAPMIPATSTPPRP